jgi:beta-glucosidase
MKRLKGFEKISLKAGASQTIKFTIGTPQLSFINGENQRVTEPGEFTVAIGNLTQNFVLQ